MYRSWKKRIALSQRPGGQYAFFRTWISATNQCAQWPENKLNHILIIPNVYAWMYLQLQNFKFKLKSSWSTLNQFNLNKLERRSIGRNYRPTKYNGRNVKLYRMLQLNYKMQMLFDVFSLFNLVYALSWSKTNVCKI